MRITYVGRSFLDYRVPVFRALSERVNGEFSLIYCADYVPEPVQAKAHAALGAGAIGLRGEVRLWYDADAAARLANTSVRLVYQPGLLRSIRATRPDVLVADGFFQWTTFALACRLRYGTPLVVCYERTAHTERHAQWYRRAYRKLVLPLVDAMSCNGQLCVDYTVALGVPRQRITTGHMVADTDGLASAAAAVTAGERRAIRAGWDDPDVAFIAVGSLSVRKGLWQLLDGWAEFVRARPGNCRLILIGDGPEEGRLKARVASGGLDGVLFHGRADYEQIARYYAAADAMIMPTLEDNWSLVVPEAMACGLPILCSRYNGCHPELVHDGVNGRVFDPLSPVDVARSLTWLVDNRAHLPAMADASRRIVAAHTPEHAAGAIFDACRLAIAHRQGPAHACSAGA
ncbi:MAG: glycosyltransferase family 4 protein [Rhodospirillales bacterium]|jgi:glycosyltransferase involved in cell wall biosynthesis|nr:glycosyltransferase family 4 protein [Rhodospirillales bacterium]